MTKIEIVPQKPDAKTEVVRSLKNRFNIGDPIDRLPVSTDVKSQLKLVRKEAKNGRMVAANFIITGLLLWWQMATLPTIIKDTLPYALDAVIDIDMYYLIWGTVFFLIEWKLFFAMWQEKHGRNVAVQTVNRERAKKKKTAVSKKDLDSKFLIYAGLGVLVLVAHYLATWGMIRYLVIKQPYGDTTIWGIYIWIWEGIFVLMHLVNTMIWTLLASRRYSRALTQSAAVRYAP